MSLNNIGKVWLVGAGCGDYDLISLRGKNILEQCDVVVYDSLIDSRVLDFVPDNAEKICVGKRSGRHSETQDNINKILVEKALANKFVVRLKGGDPFVFGRGGEEILALKENGIEYGIVPGITSSVAVAELAGIPVTHREIARSFHVITGHTSEHLLPENINVYAKLDGTLVFLMGLKNLPEIAHGLIKNGKNENTPVAVISNGACNGQKVLRSTLKNASLDAEKECMKTPAIIVVGEVVNFDFKPTVEVPLENITVTSTGTKRFVNKLSERLSKLGANVDRLDYLNVVEYRNNQKFNNALNNLNDYKWVVLTSINGAEIFLNKLISLRIDIRKLCNLKFAVIGSGTAEVLSKRGIFADLIPDVYTSNALGNALSKSISHGEKVLVLRAAKGSAELSDILNKNNIDFDDIKTYDVLSGSDSRSSIEINTDFLTFASSSGVNAFFENGYKIGKNTKIVCIGDITANALVKHGVNNFRISRTSNIDGITETILTEVQNAKIQTTEVK